MINVISSSRYKINRKFIKKKSEELMLARGISLNNEVNIAFIGKIKMKTIVEQYKKEKEALPVLTFKYDEQQEDKKILGEIVICYPYAILLAAERNKKVDDMVLRLIDHGLKNLTN
ncbi:MAG: rRNA maturation RNase YbeY [Patescibacteria group bacterium]